MGTTFTVFLPLGKEHLEEDEVFERATTADDLDDEMLQEGQIFVPDAVTKTVSGEAAIQQDSDKPLLLIVEDNADMRDYIKSYLVDTYQVLEASNGKEGAETAIEHLPDMIVSDVMMPVMDGQEMTDQLKNDERTSHIPIILLTAKAGTESKIEGLETGADDFLTKPFDAKELLVRIRNLIEQRKRLRNLLSQHIGDTAQTRIIKESAGKSMSKMDERFLEKAKAVVEEHLSDTEFTVEQFASKMAMSRVQLHRKLKSLADITATEFIRDIRLNKAAELLKDGELNVTQVSYEVGISSLSYFAKAFKEKFGVSPSEYS
jgi:DNA-binding response OmpR family regulator